jgi:formylglycine-generating enzyme required for sulfatase activity
MRRAMASYPSAPKGIEPITRFDIPFGSVVIGRGPQGDEWVEYVWDGPYLLTARREDLFRRAAATFADFRHPALALPHVRHDPTGEPDGLAYQMVAADNARWRSLEQFARHHDGTILNVYLVDLLRRVCDAAHAVHRFLLLGRGEPHLAGHGMLLPLNVMVRDDFAIRIGGLGLAAAIHRTDPTLLSDFAQVRGQSSYLAPEVRLERGAHPCRAAADVYSLGGLLFLVATNKDPLRATHSMRELNLHVSDLVEQIVRRCLDPTPSGRPDGSQAIIRALDMGSLAGEDVLPRNIPFARSEAMMSGDLTTADPAEEGGSGRGAPVGGATTLHRGHFELPPLDPRVLLRAALAETPTERAATLPEEPSARLVAAGPFLQGSLRGDHDERPMRVAYLHAYYLATHSITVEQFVRFLEANDNAAQEFMVERATSLIQRRMLRRGWTHAPEVARSPVNAVTWEGATAYARWLAAKTGHAWRLPTEAEWERATQGAWGVRRRIYPWGDDHPTPLVACYMRHWEHKGVGTIDSAYEKPKSASPWGILQMAGGVWEWCADYYDHQAYRSGDEVDPHGPEKGYLRVARGGGWLSGPHDLRCTRRRGLPPSPDQAETVGFRLALSLPENWTHAVPAPDLAPPPTSEPEERQPETDDTARRPQEEDDALSDTTAPSQ